MKLNKIICGNALEVLKTLPEESVDCVITSPPYWSLLDYKLEPLIWDSDGTCEHDFRVLNTKHDNRRFRPSETTNVGNYLNSKIYSENDTMDSICNKCHAWRGSLGLEPTVDLYIKHLIQIFYEVKRVMKSEGTLWVNIGDTYAGSCNGTNDYRTEANKSIQGIGKYAEKSYQGQGSAKAQHHESHRYEPRGKTNEVPAKSLCGIPERFALAMTDQLQFIRRNSIIWHKPNVLPSSVKDRFTVDFEYVYFLVKSNRYFFEQQFEPMSPVTFPRMNRGINENKWTEGADGQSSQTIMQPRKNLKQDLVGNPTYTGFSARYKKILEHKLCSQELGRNMRTVWKITTQPFKGSHFAVFPETLIEPMIKAGSPEFICKKCKKARLKIISDNSPHAFNIRVRDVQQGKIKFTDRMASENEISNYQEGITQVGNGKKFSSYSDCGCNAGWHPGVVLDPFCGAGTTCLVAKKLNRFYIGIDANPEYVKMAQERIEKECGTLV